MPSVYHTIDIDEFIAHCIKNKCYSFDVEHHPDSRPNSAGFELGGVSFATEYDGAITSFYEPRKDVYSHLIKTLFDNPELEAIAFNGKYDLQCLVRDGVISPYEYPEKFCDPMVAVNLLDENRRAGDLGLKTIMREGFGVLMMDFKTAFSFGLDSVEFANYAADDAHQEYFLWNFLKPKLQEEKLDPVFWKILMPSCKVFSDMEMEGVGWDISGARQLLQGFMSLRDTTKEEIFNEIGPLNLNSGDQLAKRLFEELGYDTSGIPMTDSGKRLAVNADVLNMLAGKYPVCDKIRTHNTSNKMINTYIEPLTRRALEDPNQRIHCTFWVVSSTGRTRCENPNFQNVPAWLHTRKGFENLNIRKNIIPAPGRVLIVSDLSQIELRACAHISRDPLFLKAYLEYQCTACGQTGSSVVILHKCPHCAVAENEKILKDKTIKAFWHGLDLHQITADNIPALKGNRQNGKTSNFALIYKASARRMNGEYPELTLKEWQLAINQYFETYSGVARWHIDMEKELVRTGVCTDIFGRKRRITKAELRKSYKHALNQFINFPVQASSGNLIQLSMSKIRSRSMSEKTWGVTLFPSNFVHDEVIFESVESEAEKHAAMIQEIMENTVQLRVPIRTQPLIVKNWGSAK